MIKSTRAILIGMGATLREFFRRPVTVQYPEQRPFTGNRWRGVHGLFFTENLKEELCVSCHLCARVCPAVCIEMEGHVDEHGAKRLHKFDVDLGRCIYCGYCEEVCPVDAIRLTSSSDYTTRTRDNFVLHKDDLMSVGVSAMKRGEHGALGIRNGSDEGIIYPEWLNRKAKFVQGAEPFCSDNIDLRTPLGPTQAALQNPAMRLPKQDAKVDV